MNLASRIELASEADLPAIEALAEEAYGLYVERIGRPPAPMVDDYAVHVTAGRAYVIREGNCILAYMVLFIEPDHVQVDSIAVSPDAQGRGIGSQLLEEADRIAAAHGLAEVRLYTNAAMYENLEYYPKRGFREVDRREEDGFSRVYFVKSLTR